MPDDLWDTIDLFWLCHSIDSSGSLRRIGLPEPGAVLDQDSWTMWAFAQAELAFRVLVHDLKEDQRHADELRVIHNNLKRSPK